MAIPLQLFILSILLLYWNEWVELNEASRFKYILAVWCYIHSVGLHVCRALCRVWGDDWHHPWRKDWIQPSCKAWHRALKGHGCFDLGRVCVHNSVLNGLSPSWKPLMYCLMFLKNKMYITWPQSNSYFRTHIVSILRGSEEGFVNWQGAKCSTWVSISRPFKANYTSVFSGPPWKCRVEMCGWCQCYGKQDGFDLSSCFGTECYLCYWTTGFFIIISTSATAMAMFFGQSNSDEIYENKSQHSTQHKTYEHPQTLCHWWRPRYTDATSGCVSSSPRAQRGQLCGVTHNIFKSFGLENWQPKYGLSWRRNMVISKQLWNTWTNLARRDFMGRNSFVQLRTLGWIMFCT